jgi:hypothetical protein
MSWRRQVVKLGALFRRSKPVDDLEEEIRAHLEMEEQENLESGMAPDEAHYAALRRFGNVTLAQERSREMWGWYSVETLWQDLRYGLRTLLKNPGFTVVAVLTLALGIGANTAIFSVVDSLLLRPLPVRDPGQLVVIASQDTHSRFPHRVSYPDYLDLRGQREVFAGVIAYEVQPVNMSGQGRIERIWVEGVTTNYFSTLGVSTIHGRTFLADEGQVGSGAPVIVLSYDFWQRQFAGDASVIDGAHLKVKEFEHEPVFESESASSP